MYITYVLAELNQVVVCAQKQFSDESDLIQELAVEIMNSSNLADCLAAAIKYHSDTNYKIINKTSIASVER